MVNTVGLLLITAASLGLVAAITDYSQCYSCFYQNRTNYKYCASNQKCLHVSQKDCPASDVVEYFYDCAQGYQDCTNVTFTDVPQGYEIQYAYSLSQGNGCFIKIDRMVSGSYGTMKIQFDSNDILVFDDSIKDYESEMLLGLPLTDDGWGSRTVFVANKGSFLNGFTTVFNSSAVIQAGVIAIATLMTQLLI